MNTQRYDTDLSDDEWAVLEPYLPQPQPRGRPRLHSVREILNAIFYLLRSGCAWRLLPRDLPPWKTVYHYFRLWRLTGLWEQLNAALRQRLRVQSGRASHPSAGIIDSQSVKTTGVGGPRGFDGGKKINGRKRHLLVDTQGLLVHVVVHPADLPDCDGVTLVLAPGQDLSPRLSHLWMDGSYKGRGREWIETTLGWTVSIVQHPPKPRGVWAPADAVIDWAAILPPPGFRVLPRRWVVEIVFTQMTKTDMLALWARGQHVANLDLAVGDDHTIDQEQQEFPPLVEGGIRQPLADTLAERLQPIGHARQVAAALCLALKLLLVLGQTCVSLINRLTAALILRQRDHPVQVGIGQPLALLVQARPARL